jgi:hypothetical protein
MNKIKIRATTWVSLFIHLCLFSAIAYSGIEKWGYHWHYILIAIVPPLIFFYRNIIDYDKLEKKQWKR